LDLYGKNVYELFSSEMLCIQRFLINRISELNKEDFRSHNGIFIARKYDDVVAEKSRKQIIQVNPNSFLVKNI
jgi:hypothetical protein